MHSFHYKLFINIFIYHVRTCLSLTNELNTEIYVGSKLKSFLFFENPKLYFYENRKQCSSHSNSNLNKESVFEKLVIN